MNRKVISEFAIIVCSATAVLMPLIVHGLFRLADVSLEYGAESLLIRLGMAAGSIVLLSIATKVYTQILPNTSPLSFKLSGLVFLCAIVFLGLGIYSGILSITVAFSVEEIYRHFAFVNDCDCPDLPFRIQIQLVDSVVILAIAEELVFRGILYKWLLNLKSKKLANTLQALINSFIYLWAAPVFFVFFFVLNQKYEGVEHTKSRILVRVLVGIIVFGIATMTIAIAESSDQRIPLAMTLVSGIVLLVGFLLNRGRKERV